MGEWRRFHPAAVAIIALRTLRGLLVPLVVIAGLAIARGGLDINDLETTLFYAALGLGAATVAALVEFNTTRWQATPTAIRHRQGVLSRREREVPLVRIDALDTIHGPLQRLFGVVTLHVQTAGGGRDGEIVLTAITREEADALRSIVGVQVPVEGPARERRLGLGQLIAAALTSGQAGVLAAAAAAVAQITNEVLTRTEDDSADDLFDLLPGTTTEWLELVGALLLAAWLLAALGTAVAFAGFRVARDGDRLRIRRGLLQVRETTIPVRRVRAIRVVEGVLRQPLGLAALRVEVLGYGKEPAAVQTLFPLLRRAEISRFLAELAPELHNDPREVARPPARALRRYVLPPLAGGLAIGAAAAVAFGDPWVLLVAIPPAGWGWLRWRAAGWRRTGDQIILRSRRMARSTLVFRAPLAQHVSVRQTVLQRRAGLADVRFSVGRGAPGRVRHLDAPVAWSLWGALRSPAPESH